MSTDHTDALRKCPFCRSDQLVEVEVMGPSRLHYVSCAECGACGPCQHSALLASEEWNERASPTVAPADEREAFEKWARVHHPSWTMERQGWYLNPRTENSWEGWQARASMDQPHSGETP